MGAVDQLFVRSDAEPLTTDLRLKLTVALVIAGRVILDSTRWQKLVAHHVIEISADLRAGSEFAKPIVKAALL